MAPSAVANGVSSSEATATKTTTTERPLSPRHRWWWDRIAPLLESILRSAKDFSAEDMADHMRIFRDVAIPTFGPPTPEAAVRPLLTSDGSPFESSWNFQTGSDGVVRYTFEPLGDMAGTPEDPFAGQIIPTLSSILAKAAPDTDMRWFDQIAKAWVVTPEEAALARKKMPAHVERIPQIFVAFDMKGPERLLKAYFFPMLKHFAHDIPTETLELDMIRSLKPSGDRFVAGAEKVMAYLAARAEPCPVEMMAIDCVDPAKARIKIYARSQGNSIDELRDGMTLGGTQTDEATLRGVEAAAKIWHLLLDERDGMADGQSKAPHNPRTLHKGICFVFELRAGHERIEVKAHIPICQTSASDNNTVKNVADSLRMLGWDKAADKFEKGAKQSAHCLDYTKHGGLSYLSFSYNEKGPYLSCYFSPLCLENGKTS
ncbi:aromatic prenyltransferase [Ophiocordyceps sinensis CO18]|uniref:Aromatic prenyltransferase n=1 Tax=Ophiocordyceps sinensis (strain Co18 / CGMCC 3.14243) TaxID=911162 RepID=T5ALQ4_OPHSC|nr:aromatic prenyltransferase [Ophiocordyceps sinensis CO18]